MTIRRMRILCWIPKATNTHSEYVMLIAFPLQQWLHEGASKLRNKYRVRHKSVKIPVRHTSVNTPVRHTSVNTPVRHTSVNTPVRHTSVKTPVRHVECCVCYICQLQLG